MFRLHSVVTIKIIFCSVKNYLFVGVKNCTSLECLPNQCLAEYLDLVDLVIKVKYRKFSISGSGSLVP